MVIRKRLTYCCDLWIIVKALAIVSYDFRIVLYQSKDFIYTTLECKV